MYVCVCKGITEDQLRKAIAKGDDTEKKLIDRFGVGGQCGRCLSKVREVLRPVDESLDYFGMM